MANEIYEYVSALDGSQMDIALMDMAQYKSEAWAVGERNGLPVGTSDETYENNAKYYAEQAARVIPKTGTAAVRYDVPQALTDSEKAQARANIGTPNPTELLDLKMLGYTVPRNFPVQNYEENGLFHQRVGRVDLGTLSYTYNGTYAYFLSAINGRAYSNDINMYALSYTNIGDKSSADMGTAPNMSIAPNNNNINFKLKNTAYATAAELKTALTGTYLYYELATEITRPIDGGEWVARYSNPNLLMNPFFTINQRNSSGVLSNAYIADRWFTAGGTVNVTHIDGGGIRVTATGGWNINQKIDIPDTDYVGKYVTVSAIVNGSLFRQTVLMDSSKIGTSPIGINTTGNLYIRLDVKTTYASGLYLRLTHMNSSASTDFTITAVKIEVSPVSTLLNDSAPDFATELLKCLRYFERIHFGNTPRTISAYANSTTDYLAILAMAKKRAVPTTISQNSLTGYCYSNGASSIQLSTFVIEGYESAIRIRATQSSGTHTNLAPATLYLTGGYVDVSADL